MKTYITMFALALSSPDLLKIAKVGERVRFTVRPAGMETAVTSVKTMRP